jgi:hypothetical protein
MGKSAESKLFVAHLRRDLTLISSGRRVLDNLASGEFTLGADNALTFTGPAGAKPEPGPADWSKVMVLRSEVLTLAYGRPRLKPRKSRSRYAATDARLYPRMQQLIQSGKAASSYAAAKAVAHLAEGTERGDHKVRRLQRGFDKPRNR